MMQRRIKAGGGLVRRAKFAKTLRRMRRGLLRMAPSAGKVGRARRASRAVPARFKRGGRIRL